MGTGFWTGEEVILAFEMYECTSCSEIFGVYG